MRLSRVLGSPECGKLIPYADARAREYFVRLHHQGNPHGRKTEQVFMAGRPFFITIRVDGPHVWILITGESCPKPISGMVAWDYFNPVVSIDGGQVFRGIFKKADPTVKVDSSKLVANGDQFNSLRGTMFTGEMRKVVQLMQGAGQVVPYSPGASVTHGVFVGKGHDRWIIKISSDGVVAYPMLTCVGVGKSSTLGYIPLATQEPEHPRVLLNAAGVAAAFTGKGAFYSVAGWAFSASGHKAANCFVAGRDVCSYSWQYEITIAQDGDTGEPISASMAELAEGWLHGPRATHMKFPRGDNLSILSSFDLTGGVPNTTHDCQSPVHCFYDGETLNTWSYVYVLSEGESNNVSDAANGYATGCEMFINVPLMEGSYSKNAQPSIQLNSIKPKFKVTDSRDLRISGPSIPLGMGTQQFFEFGYVDEILKFKAVYQTGHTEVTGDDGDVLIVTGWDREAVMMCGTQHTSSGAYTINYYEKGFVGGRYSYVDTVACEATFSSTFIEATIGPVLVPRQAKAQCGGGLDRAAFFGMFYIPGAKVGDHIVVAEQVVPGGWDGCFFTQSLSTIGVNFTNTAYDTADIPGWDIRTYSLELIGSGGVHFGVNVPEQDMVDWFSFITPGENDQVAIITRDAFKPGRVAYTKQANRIDGAQLGSQNIDPYVLNGNVRGPTFFFVGEP